MLIFKSRPFTPTSSAICTEYVQTYERRTLSSFPVIHLADMGIKNVTMESFTFLVYFRKFGKNVLRMGDTGFGSLLSLSER